MPGRRCRCRHRCLQRDMRLQFLASKRGLVWWPKRHSTAQGAGDHSREARPEFSKCGLILMHMAVQIGVMQRDGKSDAVRRVADAI